MRAGLRSWRQKIKQHRVTILVVAFILVVAIALIIVEVKSYGTGFAGKTLWDWLQLLVVPIILAIGGFWLNQLQKSREERTTEQRAENERKVAEQHAQTELDIAQDNQREAALQEYINKMSELLLDRNLRESTEDAEIRIIARVRTLTVLRGLDAFRKANVLQFLHETGLIDKNKRIIDLSGADFSGAHLFGTELSGADLSGTRLFGANLSMANLFDANLSAANLMMADLSDANLNGAKLTSAPLLKADLTRATLKGAKLSGATLLEANLSMTNLSTANLSGAHLKGAYLDQANLSGAYLKGAILSGAVLLEANLKGAIGITNEELEKQAKSLKGATMPDGSKHP